jgi:hypothetical protein
MAAISIIVILSLQETINSSGPRLKKLFEKQKSFMAINPYHTSLGRTKLRNVSDKYGNELWEIRLSKKERIVLVEKSPTWFVWLKLCSHDELKRKKTIFVADDYEISKIC